MTSPAAIQEGGGHGAQGDPATGSGDLRKQPLPGPVRVMTVRLPADLHRWLALAALDRRQSMNQVFIDTLQDRRP